MLGREDSVIALAVVNIVTPIINIAAASNSIKGKYIALYFYTHKLPLAFLTFFLKIFVQ